MYFTLCVLHLPLDVREAGLSWPLPEEMTDETPEGQLFPTRPKTPPTERPAPDWATVHDERKTRRVTLRLLWEEYREAYSRGLRLQPLLRALPKREVVLRVGDGSDPPGRRERGRDQSVHR